MRGLVFFGWDLVLDALAPHEPLAPLPFELMIAGGLWPPGGERNRLQWDFRCPIRQQKPVGFLVSVRELRVTEACEKRKGADSAHEIEVPVREILFVLSARVAPGMGCI